MGRRIFFGFFAFASFVLTGAFLGGFLLRMFFVVLAFSVAVRAAYVLARRRRVRLWSGWIFVIATGLAIMVLVGGHHRRLERSANAAISEGLVADRSELTPHIRCVALYLVAWERQQANERARPTKAAERAFANELCRRAALEHALYGDGYVEPKVAAQLEWELSP
jgi:hypothetical protein